MDIFALATAQAIVPEAQSAKPIEATEDFALALDVAQSGAPPGPEPPLDGIAIKGEEAAILEPNAQTLEPDFLHTIQNDHDATAKVDDATNDQDIAAFAAALGISQFQPEVANCAKDEVKVDIFGARSKPIPKLPGSIKSDDSAVDLGTDSGDEGAKKADPFGAKPQDPTGARLVDPTSSRPIDPTGAKPHDPTGARPKGAGSPAEATGEKPKLDQKHEVDKAYAKGLAIDQDAMGARGTVEVSDNAKSDELLQKGKAHQFKINNPSLLEEKVGAISETADFNLESDSSEKDDTPPAPAMVAGSTKPEVSPEMKVAAKPLPQKEINQVIQQVVDRLELMAATRPKEEITIHLNPEHLGTISVTVKLAGKSIEADMAASNDDVRAALQQHRNGLGVALADRGYKLEAVNIAPPSDQTSASSHQQFSREQAREQQAQAHQAAHHRFENSRHQGIVDSRRPLRVAAASGVDIWI